MFTLSNSQLRFVSDVLVSMGQVFMASLVVEYFIRSLEAGFLFSGIVLTLACWTMGLIITNKVHS